MKVCAVIMAGGVGTRFWPYSREARPKQLLDVLHNGKSLLELTIERTKTFAELANTLIITNKSHIEGVKAQTPGLPAENIIAEPIGRNTAPAIALAAKIAKERLGEDAVMVVLPADHMIKNDHEFTRLIEIGMRLASITKGLITLGIHPTRPETGYGYIQLDDERLPSSATLPGFTEFELRDIFCAHRFAEKPDKETAERFVESGIFLWNSGMFIWRVDAIEEALRTYTEGIMEHIDVLSAEGNADFTKKLNDVYSKIRGVSIDYAVMERAKNVYVLRASALGWSDLGSWDEVWRLSEKDLNNNVIEQSKDIVVRNSKGNLVFSKSKELIVLNGVNDLVVVDSGDAILITHRDKAQSVKDITDYLKRNSRNEYL
ncbi:MAG TPA: sugar phosphate nucleotidyltransferase [Candidatus Kapabacteria bacterium]|nr:sugar phosphate nucleotidyltransferase [Candidatus Kapabacteria bacterium]